MIQTMNLMKTKTNKLKALNMTKETLMSRIVYKMSHDKDYLDRWMPRLKKFTLIELIGFAIDHDVIDAGSLYK